MVTKEISVPMNINPQTGRKQYTEVQLAYYKPTWRRQWELFSDLDDDMIDMVVNKIHCSPFGWPGTRIAEGSSRGINKIMKEVAHEWRKRIPRPTGGQIYREAKKRLNRQAREEAKDKEIEDPFALEYYLTQFERKEKRNPFNVR